MPPLPFTCILLGGTWIDMAMIEGLVQFEVRLIRRSWVRESGRLEMIDLRCRDAAVAKHSAVFTPPSPACRITLGRRMFQLMVDGPEVCFRSLEF